VRLNKPPISASVPVTHTNPVVNVAQETSIPPHADPLCPRCQQRIPANAVFCASCGFSLSPAVALQTQGMVMPASSESSFFPLSLDAAQPPRELVREQIQGDGQDRRHQEEKGSGRLGQRLGNYQIISLLGEGGFAEVYLGEHIHLGSQAAIKILHSQLARDERERFLAEARTLVRLVHPHIVRVLDFGIEDKTPFLVMDVAIDGTLRQRHPKGTRLSHSTVNSYVQQVADALQFAHDQRIIHRDIKPENMLIGRQNTIVLSDFGIATVAQSSRYQSVQDMAGTIAYMSPEQIQSHPRPASDQYALGVVVYEWLCGTRPFQGSFTEIAVKHAMVPPPPLRKYVPALPTAVEEVVLKALAKDPKDRFVNIQTFAQALAQAS
jgi:serine/threonine protein kinase